MLSPRSKCHGMELYLGIFQKSMVDVRMSFDIRAEDVCTFTRLALIITFSF